MLPSEVSPDEVREWLSQALARKGARRVELFRALGNRPTDDLVTLWDRLSANDDDAATLGAEMLRSATRDGRGVQQGVRVSYVLLAFDEAHKQVDRLFLQVASGAAATTDTQALEVRDLGGVASHVLTELTKMSALVVRAFEGRDEALLEQLKHTTARLQTVERDREESLVKMQRFILFEMEQRQLTAKLEREEKRDAQIFEKVSAWGPMIVTRLLGGGPGKGAPAADAMLSALFESFTEAEVSALMDAPISQEKKMLFGELYMSFMKAKEAKAARTPLNETANGHAVGGDPS